MSAAPELDRRTVGAHSHSSRDAAPVRLIVLHDDPCPAEEALAAFSAADATRAPHYYVSAEGVVTALVPEKRSAHHSGLATWERRRRNIDRISIGVVLEHTPGTPYPPAQYVALDALVRRASERHGLSDADLLTWVPDEQQPRSGQLAPLFVPPAPAAPADAGVLGGQDVGAISFSTSGSVASQALADFLRGEAYRQRGEGFRADWALHLRAAALGVGAPLARNTSASQQVQAGGKKYGFQPFGADTLFNEVPQWTNVQRLSDLLAGSIPASGPGRALLEAAFQASGAPLNPSWGFHTVAVRAKLGTPLGGSYRITVAGQVYSLQVFSGDTLYTSIATPESATQWNDVRRLSQTPDSDLARALWVETYKPCGATCNHDAPLHQLAVREKLGAPLTGVYTASVSGSNYQVQVFALDTVYQAPDGTTGRLSALPGPAQATAPATPTGPAITPVATTGRFSAPAVPAGAGADWPPPPANLRPMPNTAARMQAFGKIEFVPNPQPNNAEAIRITNSWQQENLVQVTVPQLAKISGGPRNGVVLFHRLAAAQLAALFAAWEEVGLLNRVLSWSGTFNARFIRGSTSELSQHAFGTAFDINVPQNGLGAVPALVGKPGCVRELVQIANELGFYWGGHFTRLDGMHFEVARITPV